MTNLINGDARHIALADESVQCIITSPIYWGLRSYLAEGDPYKHLELGLERVPDCLGWATGHACGECYVCHIVAVMRECWRVLRSDGTCWLNLGDSYAGNNSSNGEGEKRNLKTEKFHGGTAHLNQRRVTGDHGLKPKDLCLIPSRVALALQAAGWWVRSEIIWHKPNPMPESVTDRPTKAHEMIYLLTKRAEYYYDSEAIKERGYGEPAGHQNKLYSQDGQVDRLNNAKIKQRLEIEQNGFVMRNKRSVWTVATQPYSGAHYAVFPIALVEPMILAGTSQRGACPTCGKAWRRVVDRVNPRLTDDGYKNKSATPKMMSGDDRNDYGTNKTGLAKPGWRELPPEQSTTLGFAPACTCYATPPLPAEPADTSNGDMEQSPSFGGMAAYKAERARLLNDVYPLLPVVPCVVFDPFVGSGTVLRVAIKHGRIGIGNDLNLNYAPLTVDRTSKIQRVMSL